MREYFVDNESILREIDAIKLQRESLEARALYRERQNKKTGSYFSRSIKERHAKAQEAQADAKERNAKLKKDFAEMAYRSKRVHGPQARAAADSKVAAQKEAYLSTVRRLYPQWRDQVDKLVVQQATSFETQVKASEARRKKAAEEFSRELQSRNRLMYGHHAAKQAHEQETMEEMLRHEARRKMADQEGKVASSGVPVQPVYIPPALQPEPAWASKPAVPPQTMVPTLMTHLGPAPFSLQPPIPVPVPVGNFLQQPMAATTAAQYQYANAAAQEAQAHAQAIAQAQQGMSYTPVKQNFNNVQQAQSAHAHASTQAIYDAVMAVMATQQANVLTAQQGSQLPVGTGHLAPEVQAAAAAAIQAAVQAGGKPVHHTQSQPNLRAGTGIEHGFAFATEPPLQQSKEPEIRGASNKGSGSTDVNRTSGKSVASSRSSGSSLPRFLSKSQEGLGGTPPRSPASNPASKTPSRSTPSKSHSSGSPQPPTLEPAISPKPLTDPHSKAKTSEGLNASGGTNSSMPRTSEDNPVSAPLDMLTPTLGRSSNPWKGKDKKSSKEKKSKKEEHLEGGAKLTDEHRHICLTGLLETVYHNRYQGKFYDNNLRSAPEAIDEVLHLALQGTAPADSKSDLCVEAVCQLVKNFPSGGAQGGLLPESFITHILGNKKTKPLDNSNAADEAETRLLNAQSEPAREFWKELTAHLAHMIKSQVTSSGQTASVFSKLLVHPDLRLPPGIDRAKCTSQLQAMLANRLEYYSRSSDLPPPPSRKEVVVPTETRPASAPVAPVSIPEDRERERADSKLFSPTGGPSSARRPLMSLAGGLGRMDSFQDAEFTTSPSTVASQAEKPNKGVIAKSESDFKPKRGSASGRKPPLASLTSFGSGGGDMLPGMGFAAEPKQDPIRKQKSSVANLIRGRSQDSDSDESDGGGFGNIGVKAANDDDDFDF